MERITCNHLVPGNIDCQNCEIKTRKKDQYGTYHLREGEAIQKGLTIEERPTNAWIGLPSQRIARRAKGENGVVIIINE